MSRRPDDQLFTGSIPDLYDRYLVPLIFQPYATELADRIVARRPETVLEIAAGTGVVTRALADRSPDSVAITSTDLNQPMIDHAASIGTSRPVTWRQADVDELPFEDSSFDTVVCQFGVQFFPDRVRAYREIRRVLRPNGAFLFDTWDRIETNELADVVTQAMAGLFPDDPPRFLARTPHGYHDLASIQAELAAAGFREPADAEGIEARSRASTCDIPAIGYCQGTPLRTEIEARDADGLAEATKVATRAVRDRFGATDIDARIRAYIIDVRTP